MVTQTYSTATAVYVTGWSSPTVPAYNLSSPQLHPHVAAMLWDEEGLWLEEDPSWGGYGNTPAFVCMQDSANPEQLHALCRNVLLRKAWSWLPQALKDNYLGQSRRTYG